MGSYNTLLLLINSVLHHDTPDSSGSGQNRGWHLFGIWMSKIGSSPFFNTWNANTPKNAETLLVNRSFIYDPDYIRGFGYPAEAHDVTTADGYILTMVRIPHGKNYKTVAKRKPVIVHHGLGCDSTCWLAGNDEEKLLVLQLADLGFDVWLANARGTRYSRRHTKYTVKDKAFFDYSMDDLGAFDVPAEIDYVLETTGERQIIWMGWSLGGIAFHIAMSRHPQYNAKVSLMVGMAPAVYLSNLTGVLKLLLLLVGPVATDVVIGAVSYGAGELPAPFLGYLVQTIGVPITTLCSWKAFKPLCYIIESLFAGPASPGKTSNPYPKVVSGIPSPMSLKVVRHLIQELKSGNFQHYDYGRSKNLKVYGTATPPLHNVKATTAPVAIFYGKTDFLVTPKDALRLASELPNLVYLHEIKPKWNHADFVYGSDANEKLNRYILALALRY